MHNISNYKNKNSLNQDEIMSENLKEGDLIGGQYEILSIRKGGMGIVYLTQDKEEIPVDNITPYGTALKTFHDRYLKSDRAIERFKREALTWVKLSEISGLINIVKAFNVIEHYGKPFIVLEYVTGPNLGQWMKFYHKELEYVLIEKCVDIAKQFCNGMMQAHKKIPGIVHRDIKPANILIKERPQGYEFGDYPEILKITDWGLVKVLDEIDSISPPNKNRKTSLTETGWELGTYLYRSPEQTLDSKSVTLSSDIYSFGIVLFEILTVGRKYESDEWHQFMNLLIKELPENRAFSPKKFNDKIPNELNTFIMKCLEKYPDKRFNSFEEMIQQLNRMSSPYAHGIPFSMKGKSEIEKLVDQGLTLANLGKSEEAIDCFDKIIKIEPKNVAAWASKGNCFIQLGQLDEAMLNIDKALELNPSDPITLMYKGNCFHALNNIENALEYYDKALKIDPKLVDALTYKAGILSNMGSYYNEKEKLEEAIESLQKALQIDPINDTASLFMGITLVSLGRIEEAIRYFNNSIDSNPENDQTYYELGRCYAIKGDYQKAMVIFKKSVSINPSPEAYYNLGACAYNCKDISQAINYLRKAIQMNPNYLRAHQLLDICQE